MKYSAYITVTDCYNRFAIIEVFIALNRNIRPYVKWVYSIFDLVLCIAFSCTYIAKLFCLPLFPSVCILWHKPQFFVETLAICVIIEITTYAFPKKGYFLKQKELNR